MLWTIGFNLYKNGDYRRSFAKVTPFNDRDKSWAAKNNVDPTLAVKALYNQDDITIFGVNAGEQCVAMSLCALM